MRAENDLLMNKSYKWAQIVIKKYTPNDHGLYRGSILYYIQKIVIHFIIGMFYKIILNYVAVIPFSVKVHFPDFK